MGRCRFTRGSILSINHPDESLKIKTKPPKQAVGGKTTQKEEENKMKVLKGLEEIKYMALYTVFMYDHTGNRTYRFTLNHLIAKALDDYGLAGLTEVLEFIQSETE